MLVNYISIVLYFSVVLTSTKASLMDTSFNTWLVKTRCFVSPACMKLFFHLSFFSVLHRHAKSWTHTFLNHQELVVEVLICTLKNILLSVTWWPFCLSV